MAITGYVVASNSITGDRALYRIEGLAKKVGGVVSIVNQVTTIIAQDAGLAGTTTQIAQVGTTVSLQTVGLALTTIGWDCQVSIIAF